MGLFGKKQMIILKDHLTEDEFKILNAEMDKAAQNMPDQAATVYYSMGSSIRRGDEVEVKNCKKLCLAALSLNMKLRIAHESTPALYKKLEEVLK